MTIRPIAAWYDFWIGIFYDQKKCRLYIFPVPMLGFVVQLERQPAVAATKPFDQPELAEEMRREQEIRDTW